jgi:hypothetical protein
MIFSLVGKTAGHLPAASADQRAMIGRGSVDY